jgi:hypothetical protein
VLKLFGPLAIGATVNLHNSPNPKRKFWHRHSSDLESGTSRRKEPRPEIGSRDINLCILE